MSAKDRHNNLFGRIDSLAEDIPWSTGVSNMLEWLTWSTNDVLGITKTKYRELIVELTHDPKVRDGTLDSKIKYVERQLDKLIKESDRPNRYDKPRYSLAGPREALRRAKYFSEDYLNREFDIFWGLVSDQYLDEYYGRYFNLAPGGHWHCHGNSGLFVYSTRISEMQMDNLSYNPDRKTLVANELKLGGKKNKDQILKYALMYQRLVERNFIEQGTRFVLFFLTDLVETPDWSALLQAEVAYCRASPKGTLRAAVAPECIRIADGATYASATWDDLLRFNGAYLSRLSDPARQVEKKLIWGFNEALAAKAFRQGREPADGRSAMSANISGG